MKNHLDIDDYDFLNTNSANKPNAASSGQEYRSAEEAEGLEILVLSAPMFKLSPGCRKMKGANGLFIWKALAMPLKKVRWYLFFSPWAF